MPSLSASTSWDKHCRVRSRRTIAATKRFTQRLELCPSSVLQCALTPSSTGASPRVTGYSNRRDTLRHCVDASYADIFVTCDTKLHPACAEIKVGVRVMTMRAFATTVQIECNGPREPRLGIESAAPTHLTIRVPADDTTSHGRRRTSKGCTGEAPLTSLRFHTSRG